MNSLGNKIQLLLYPLKSKFYYKTIIRNFKENPNLNLHLGNQG